VGIQSALVLAPKLDNRAVSNDFLSAYALLSWFPTKVFTALCQNIPRMNYHIGLIVKVVKNLAFIVAGLFLIRIGFVIINFTKQKLIVV
jgi:hypothetical protein